MEKRSLEESKVIFLESINAETKCIKAVSLAIDCVIGDCAIESDKPIIFITPNDYEQQRSCDLFSDFCKKNLSFMHGEHFYTPKPIVIGGNDAISACKCLIQNMRKSPGFIYWADDASLFKSLPSGLFHVIDVENSRRGTNVFGESK